MGTHDYFVPSEPVAGCLQLPKAKRELWNPELSNVVVIQLASQPQRTSALGLSDDTPGRPNTLRLFWGGRCCLFPPTPFPIPPNWIAEFSPRELRRRKGGSSQLGIGGHAYDITVQDG